MKKKQPEQPPREQKKSATNAEINQLVAEALLIASIKRHQKMAKETAAKK